MAFIRNLLTFVACEESKTSHKALEEQSQAQVLLLTFFWQHAACSKKNKCLATVAAIARKIECNRQATSMEDKLREVEEAFHEI